MKNVTNVAAQCKGRVHHHAVISASRRRLKKVLGKDRSRESLFSQRGNFFGQNLEAFDGRKPGELAGDSSISGAGFERQHPWFDLGQLDQMRDHHGRRRKESEVFGYSDFASQEDLLDPRRGITREEVRVLFPAPSSACGFEYLVGTEIQVSVEVLSKNERLSGDLDIAEGYENFQVYFHDLLQTKNPYGSVSPVREALRKVLGGGE